MQARKAFSLAYVLLILGLLGVTATATAATQGPWVLPATDLSAPGQDAEYPRLAASPDGTVTALWHRYDGSDWIVQSATRSPGDSFSTPLDLSAPGRDAYDPELSVSPSGTVTAIWRRWAVGGDWIIQASTRPPGSSFGTPVDLSAAGQDATAPQVATSPDGTVTAVWVRNNGSNFIVQSATRPPGTSFGAPVDLSAPGQDAMYPQVVASPDGTVTAVWRRKDGSNWITQSATRPPGGSFGAPVDLSAPGQDTDEPELAASPDGTVTAVWRHSNASKWIIQSATRPPGGSFGAPVDLSAPGQNAFEPELAASPDGTVTVVWRRQDGSNYIAQAATRPPGGSFGAPVDLSAPGQNAFEPELAASPDGTVTAIWQRRNGSNWIIQSATRPPGGSFGAPVDLSAPGWNASSPRLAVSPDGTATAIWQRENESNKLIIQVARTLEPSSPSFSLKVTPVGSGSGTVSSSPTGISCGSTCSHSFDSGSSVTLTATAASGSTFAGWSGDCSGKARTCSVTMDRVREVTASFSKTTVPANPPNDNVAIYDPKTGKLKIRLKCGPQYKPKCVTMIARAVAGKAKKAKVMSSQVKVKNRGAGKWSYATLKVKPKFRQQVKNMGNKTTKTLWVRIGITWKKGKKKKQSKTIHHRYRVMVRQ